MTAFIYVFVELVYLILSLLQFLMLIRAVMSWMPLNEDSTVYNLLIGITEPIIIPVRMLLDKIPITRTLPIDLSFVATVLILSTVQMMLPVVRL